MTGKSVLDQVLEVAEKLHEYNKAIVDLHLDNELQLENAIRDIKKAKSAQPKGKE